MRGGRRGGVVDPGGQVVNDKLGLAGEGWDGGLWWQGDGNLPYPSRLFWTLCVRRVGHLESGGPTLSSVESELQAFKMIFWQILNHIDEDISCFVQRRLQL